MAKSVNPGAITVGGKGRVTLSDEIRKQLGIAEGDVLIPELTDHGTLELIPAALIPRDQVWFAHPEMQRRMAEAHEDVAAGRTLPVATPSALSSRLAELKKAKRGD